MLLEGASVSVIGGSSLRRDRKGEHRSYGMGKSKHSWRRKAQVLQEGRSLVLRESSSQGSVGPPANPLPGGPTTTKIQRFNLHHFP